MVEPPPAAQISAAGTPGFRTLNGLAVAVVAVAALYFGKDILLPVTLAVLLSFVLSPVVRLLRRIHIPRVIATVFSVALALIIIGGLGALIGSQLVDVAHDLPSYQFTIERKIGQLRDATIGRISAVVTQVEGAIERSRSAAPAAPESANAPHSTTSEPPPVPVIIQQPPPDPVRLARSILLPALQPLATAAIIFVVAVFILLQQHDLRDRIIRLFGTHDMHRTTVALDDAAARLSRYFLVQIGINASFGAIIGAGLYFIGLPQPMLWGIIAGLLRFIPYIGAYVAAGIPILLAAAVYPGWSEALWVAGLFLVVEPVMGQVVEPMLYSRSTGLSPIAVVLSVIFWGWLWGPVGLILSTPITLCLVVLGRHVDQLEFLSVLFGDRPPLTTAESFYQRLLAGDADELQEQAEELLKSISLTSYYDDVVMPGLEMAAADLARQVLHEQQVRQIQQSVLTLVSDLESHHADARHASPEPSADEQTAPQDGSLVPAPPPMEGAVACIAARTVFDELAATMLAQVARRHGLRADLVSQNAVSRPSIEGFVAEGLSVLCICSVDAAGSVSSLRFLIRRLRQRAAGVPVIVALWPRDHRLFSDRELMRSLAADHYVPSLQKALQACREFAEGSQQPGGSSADAEQRERRAAV